MTSGQQPLRTTPALALLALPLSSAYGTSSISRDQRDVSSAIPWTRELPCAGSVISVLCFCTEMNQSTLGNSPLLPVLLWRVRSWASGTQVLGSQVQRIILGMWWECLLPALARGLQSGVQRAGLRHVLWPAACGRSCVGPVPFVTLAAEQCHSCGICVHLR